MTLLMTLVVAVDGKRKKWFCDGKPYLTLSGRLVPSMTVGQAYKYLGTSAGVRTTPPDVRTKLESGLRELTRAPLRPQQRMFILRVHLIPSLYHQLVLDSVTKNTLAWLDRIIRRQVRGWLRLPHDTPRAMFHANVGDGGLGIPTLVTQVCIMKRDRMSALFAYAPNSGDDVLCWLVNCSTFVDKFRNQYGTVVLNDAVVTSKREVRSTLARNLHGTIDGNGLRQHGAVPYTHSWVGDGNQLMSGRNYIGAIQLRCNTLYTKGRASRGRRFRESRCGLCREYESLGHIIQTCARTWALRNKRHDVLVDRVEQLLRRNGYEVQQEPNIPTPAGVRRPDIVAWVTGSSCIVVDATIVADHVDLAAVDLLKRKYYDTPEIRSWAAGSSLCSPESVVFISVAFNWRGALAKASADSLLSCGLTKQDLKLLSVCVVERGVEIYLFSRRITLRN